MKVTLRRVRAVGKQWVLHILSVCLQNYLYCMHSACAVLYCRLWPVLVYHILPYFLIKWHDFRNSVVEHKRCVSIFSTHSVWNDSYSKQNCARYDHYSTVQYSTVQYSTVQYSTVQYSTVQYSTQYACKVQIFVQILIKLEFHREIFRKIPKYQIL
jgi:hypothetical protein